MGLYSLHTNKGKTVVLYSSSSRFIRSSEITDIQEYMHVHAHPRRVADPKRPYFQRTRDCLSMEKHSYFEYKIGECLSQDPWFPEF